MTFIVLQEKNGSPSKNTILHNVSCSGNIVYRLRHWCLGTIFETQFLYHFTIQENNTKVFFCCTICFLPSVNHFVAALQPP